MVIKTITARLRASKRFNAEAEWGAAEGHFVGRQKGGNGCDLKDHFARDNDIGPDAVADWFGFVDDRNGDLARRWGGKVLIAGIA